VHRRRLATKEYTTASNGRVLRREFSEAKHFRVTRETVADIGGLYNLVAHLGDEASAFIIRGELLPGADPAHTRRVLRGDAATFADVPRAWLMLDADKIPLPSTASVLADPANIAQYLVDLFAGFAPELEGVTAVVQFSGSAGIAELAEAEAVAGLPDRWSGVAVKGGTVSAHLPCRI
jgi:hypothetical protein